MSLKLTLLTDFEQLIQSAFFAAWRLDMKDVGTLLGFLLTLVPEPKSFVHIPLSLLPSLPSKPATNLVAPHCGDTVLVNSGTLEVVLDATSSPGDARLATSFAPTASTGRGETFKAINIPVREPERACRH